MTWVRHTISALGATGTLGLALVTTLVTLTWSQDTLAVDSTSFALDKVTVTDPLRSLGPKATESVARMPLKNLENPQAYSVVSKELTREKYLINSDVAQFTVPEYFTVDATIFFEQPRYRIGVKIDNVTDEVYWNGWGSPQPPRRFISNVAFKF